MTIAQRDITRFIHTQFTAPYRINPEGKDVIRLTKHNGQTKRLTCNIFGDIMDADTEQIISESDLPHTISQLPCYARPTTWKINPSNK